MNYKFNDDNTSNALNDIYHSSSMHEMKIKADLYGIDLNDVNNILFLIDTTTYHHAFWPHTSKRFIALKNLLRHSHDLPKHKMFLSLKDAVSSRLLECEHGKWIKHTPGGRQEIKNLRQVIDILDKLERDCR